MKTPNKPVKKIQSADEDAEMDESSEQTKKKNYDEEEEDDDFDMPLDDIDTFETSYGSDDDDDDY